MLAEQLDRLEALIQQGKIDQSSLNFAKGLLENCRKFGASARRQYWVGVLVGDIQRPAPSRTIGDFSGVYRLFETARKHLRYPKIVLQTEQGPLKLYLSGPRSTVPDTVNVTDGGDFQSGTWYGRIAKEGVWTVNRTLDEARLSPVESLLRKLADDPEGTASAYGKLTGNCCFCHRSLADERSTEVGYGPHCAEKWGLSWGSKVRSAPSVALPSEKKVSRRLKVRRSA